MSEQVNRRTDPDTGDADCYTIPEFCRRNRISESFYHKLRNQGLGPRTIRLGARVLITREDARQWRKRHAHAADP